MLIPYESDYIDTEILDKQMRGPEKAYVDWLKQRNEIQSRLIDSLIEYIRIL